jgi:hypothetical protein
MIQHERAANVTARRGLSRRIERAAAVLVNKGLEQCTVRALISAASVWQAAFVIRSESRKLATDHSGGRRIRCVGELDHSISLDQKPTFFEVTVKV